MADNSKTQLYVWSKDGTKVAYSLSQNPKLTFTETEMVITGNNLEVIYPIAEMDRFAYKDEVTTLIFDLSTDERHLVMKEDYLLFPAIDCIREVSIYSLNGTKLLKKTLPAEGEYAYPFSNLSSGVYMVKVNGLTYKIVKK